MIRVRISVFVLVVLAVFSRAAAAQQCAWTLHPVTSGASHTGAVSTSEDGRRIAFLRFGSAGAEIQLFDTQTATTTPLGIGWNPVIAGNGNRIAFITLSNQLAMVDVETGVTTTWEVGPINEPLAVSADGGRIAFVSDQSYFTPPDADPPTPEVWVMEVATGTARQVSNADTFTLNAVAISGDGTRVAWVEDWGILKSFDFVTEQTVDLGFGYAPTLTRDGRQVAYINSWGTELRLIDVVSFTDRLLATSDRGFAFPVFSSNGARVAFMSSGDIVGSNADLDGELFVVDVATNAVSQITSGTGNTGMSTLGVNGDGTRIVFTDFRPLNGPNPEANYEVFLAVCAPEQALYEFGGFENPLLDDGSTAFRKGRNGSRAIPVMFQLTRDGAVVSSAVASISVQQVLNVATGTVDMTDLTEDTGQSNQDTSLFRFDSDSGRYIFNLSTKNLSAPATYRISVTLDDGSVHTVTFSLQ